jgi:formylglycine-generating enzyme required for sulfatase activity
MPTPDIFISYRVADTQVEARLIYSFLVSRFGEKAVFLDKKRINPGDTWPDELEQNASGARVILALVKDKEKWVGKLEDLSWRLENPDDWVRKELETGLGKGVLVPVFIDSAVFPALHRIDSLKTLPTVQGYKMTTDEKLDVCLQELSEQLEALGLSPNPTQAPALLDEYPLPDDVPDPLKHYDAPFLGLRHFDENAARLFHGRTRDLLEFFKLVQDKETRLISLYGESGVGKSSFLAAGALPRLRQFARPVYTRRDKTHRNGLAGQLADLRSQAAPGHLPPVFILDQAEEMFTDPLTGEQDALINEIGHLLQQNKNATVVMGFRSDYYNQMNRWRLGVRVKHDGLDLKPLDQAAIREVIEGVYKDKTVRDAYELELGKNFAQRVAADLVHTESGGVAAILQNRLQKLYRTAKDKADASQPGAVLTYEDYRELVSDSSAEKQLLDFQVEQLRVEGITADDRTIYGELSGFVVEKATSGSVVESKITMPPDLLGKMLKVNLLTRLSDSKAVRLSHDLLAREVQQRYQQALQDENEQGKFKLVRVRMRDARRMIDNIEFEQAFNEYRETTHLDVLPDELWPTGFELAYIYLQAGKTQDGAYLLAETLKHLERAGKLPEKLQDLSLPGNTDTAAMLERLRQSEPEYYLKMERRYFPNMIFVKGGTFDMGDVMGDGDGVESNELPVQSVTLSDYELADSPQTWWQYGLYCFAKVIELPLDSGFGRADKPVINVNWNDAVRYTEWLSLHRGRKYRLPTDAEWEFAARECGLKVKFGNGKDIADPEEINFDSYVITPVSNSGENRHGTSPVKTFTPNSLGIFDMSGNIWEWCADYFEIGIESKGGNRKDYYRNIRGGSWASGAYMCLTTRREVGEIDFMSNKNGFRIVSDLQCF